ncbi:metal ABC transporter solute-binding protein, Zn/Mn family [Acetobacter oeni]|uniref:ABC transporter substrate-binding protein n=1 Tax=Acetobacter oeni TaxID=304077 RepID=A0A511XM51_9PROT|nr:zinc ABC transporter substrate-binding protein [Acetobacter oeni]MBB3884017.1 zinc/manganese transport system substrate-binding protein [Acetobacter oeni]NHO20075.1 metal ABC transporter substrate-binding protein [Acetobacter oeni]GBR03744.1 metal ion ABC transporter substrate-binding periplasmic protein [Acetobacter oeni LMG 21952]GEN64006.1 ABC transporter substrate-binding protein [Acetobacter oeni]
MRLTLFLLSSLFFCAVLLVPARAGGVVSVVAAENVWGDVAVQLGGKNVAVSSIISAPEADPHLFEPTPATARAIAEASVAIANGAGFDPWMDRLVAARGVGVAFLRVSDVAGWHDGENQHLWFDPDAVAKMATAFVAALHGAGAGSDADGRLAGLDRDVAALKERIAGMRRRFGGARISATEPLLGHLTSELGLVTENDAFQLAVMNDVEPGPAEVARFEGDLRGGRLRLLIYNEQTVTPSASRLLGIAHQVGVPCVAVTETLPPAMHWQGWMTRILDLIEQALEQPDRVAGAR